MNKEEEEIKEEEEKKEEEVEVEIIEDDVKVNLNYIIKFI